MKKSLNIFAILGVLSVVTYCSSNYFGRAWSRNSANNPATVTQDCSTNVDCKITNGFDPQPTEPGNFWPEIAFVGDTSVSMGDNYEALSASLTQWIAHLQDEGIENFCIGYIPSHVGEYAGLYYAPAGYPKCMCTDEYEVGDTSTPGTIVYNMKYILTHYPATDYTNASHTVVTYSQGEAGLYSLHTAVTDADRISRNQAAGCMKPQYTFAPIIIADENDISTTIDGPTNAPYCSGISVSGVDMNTIEFDNSDFPELGDNDTIGNANKNSSKYNAVDSQCLEARGRFLYYSESTPDPISGKYKLAITPKSISNEIVNFNGTLPSFASGVGFYAGDQPNSSSYKGFKGQDGPGWGNGGESGLAAQFGQEIANLKYAVENNQSAFNAELNELADSLAQSVAFHYVFDLRDENGESASVCETKLDSLVVKVNGEEVPSSEYTLNSDRDRVTFDKTYDWDYGDQVVISFNTCS